MITLTIDGSALPRATVLPIPSISHVPDAALCAISRQACQDDAIEVPSP